MTTTVQELPFKIHEIENNSFSQSILEANRERLTGQCKTVLDALKRGERLTVRDAMIQYGIGDLRRRIKDLKDHAGIDIKSEMIGNGFKRYFLELSYSLKTQNND